MYHKAVIVGATSGIGYGLASALVAQGTHVINIGRRSDKLDNFAFDHAAADVEGRITKVIFDITSLPDIPRFVQSLTQAHPDIDCIILNSGIQRPFDFTNPSGLSSSDLAELDTETATNYTAYVHLTAALLPFFFQRSEPASLIYISATLALVPGLLRTPNYNASKAALHTFILNLREQLNAAEAGKFKSKPRVIEVFPPAVQTELHDEKHQPDLVNGGEIGIPLKTFVDACLEVLQGENVPDEFMIGNDGKMAEVFGFEKERQEKMKGMIGVLKTGLAKFLKKQ